MKWISTNELRKKFLSFFESKQHLVQESFPLIPNGDNSLLLINSGMAPMKKYFTGELTPPSNRVVSCQKCIRTPDIERVGITARHGTFFEMLGNFSFGDYFKIEAIRWAWEFFTETLEIPEDRLWVSVFEKDDEAFGIWKNEIGVKEKRIVRMGAEDNFWEHGKGPCGPCSEIYFDRGEKYSCGKPSCGVGCECDRYVEVWNLVFSQFFNDGNGNYSDLAKKNIDTGMGLERLACVMQDVDNLFMIDSVQKIISKVCEITNKTYGQNEKDDVVIRIIADHMRSTTFMAADGISPSNEGRGYVFRRLLRRASRCGRLLGIDFPFLSEISKTVIEESKEAYPELSDRKEYILKLIKAEEESFAKTIDQGLNILKDVINKVKDKGENVISGSDVFKLNDTFGFPVDLTREIAAEHLLKLDEEGFNKLLSKQRTMAREARKKAGKDAWLDKSIRIDAKKTEFVGYDKLEDKAKVLAILKDEKFVENCNVGDSVIIIINKTPFYAQGGGQVGDSGYIDTPSARMMILDTSKNNSGHFLHHAKVLSGEFKINDVVCTHVDAIRRSDIMRNHTAAHLLQAALKKVLGNHVSQAGQMVDEKILRFDFTHFSALSELEIKQVEEIINDEILKAVSVNTSCMNLSEAKNTGATALFDEKYGDKVRVVSLQDDFSKELCAGTHVDNTAKISLFKILSESSVAAGVRRIEAVTGRKALELLSNSHKVICNIATQFKSNDITKLPNLCAELIKDNKEKNKCIEELHNKIASSKISAMLKDATDISQLKLICKRLNNTSADTAKSISDTLKNTCDSLIIVFAIVNDDKASLLCSVTDKAVENGINAGAVIKQIAILTGGNGGGKANFAMAGVKDISKLDKALNSSKEIVESMLNS